MLCRDIMKSIVKSIDPQSTIAEAAALMRDEGIGFLPVCDAGGQIVGTLTDRDIVIRVVAERASWDEPAFRFMTPKAISCRADDEVGIAQDLMSDLQISRVICIAEDGSLEGVVSLSDIAQLGHAAEAAKTLESVSGREAHT